MMVGGRARAGLAGMPSGDISCTKLDGNMPSSLLSLVPFHQPWSFILSVIVTYAPGSSFSSSIHANC